MKLFIIRHCERHTSPLYKSELTLKGKINAMQLNRKLYANNIKKIYSSPYIRCIQTIQSYSELYNVLPNIEYGFSETTLTLIKSEVEDILDDFQINLNYNNIIDIQTLNNSNFILDDTIKRVGKLIIQILNENRESTKNILICTHMTIINILLFLFNKISYNDVVNDIEQECGELIEIIL